MTLQDVTERIGRLPVSEADPNRAMLVHADFDIWRTLGELSAYEMVGHGDGNIVLRHPEAKPGPITFEPGSKGNLVLCGSRHPPRQPVVIAGSGHSVIIGPTSKFQARIQVQGRNNLFYSGLGSTCNLANVVIQGHEKSIILGRDCMLSFDLTLRGADSHAIIDLTDMKVTNAPESILIGKHVWLGEGATLLKGVRIGRGSIIAAAALVTGEVPAASLAAGIPARVLRSNVSWTRSSQPQEMQLRELERAIAGNDLHMS